MPQTEFDYVCVHVAFYYHPTIICWLSIIHWVLQAVLVLSLLFCISYCNKLMQSTAGWCYTGL